jgi:tetratricopeptide (TPR) repeat protein
LDAAVAVARPEQAPAPPRALTRALLGAAIFALACAVYLPIRGHDWLNYDDDIYVTGNAEVQRGLSWQGLRWAFASQQGANWFPLTRLSWMLDRELHGSESGGFLLTNLLLHALTSAIFFFALAKLAGELGRSAFAAAVFAVHPLHVESVAWVSARKDVLSGFFFMLALLAYGYAARRRRAWAAQAAVFLSLALGLLAKPMLVTLPFLLVLLDGWPLGRLTGQRGGLDRGLILRALREKLPLFALAAVSCAVTLRAQAAGGAVVSLERVAFSERVANALVAYPIYLRKFFWPADLAVFYPHAAGQIPLWQPLLAAALLLGLTLLALRAGLRRGYLAVGWLWFLGMLVPTIGLVQVGSQALADRYMYLPLAGLALALVWGAAELAGARTRGRGRALALAGMLVIAALSAATRGQLRHWRDSQSLFSHALEVTEQNHIAHAFLGAAHAERGETAETIRHYREAVRIRPDFRTAANNLAWLLATTRDASLRDPALAVSLAESAAAPPAPANAAVLDTLAAAYAAAGRYGEAARVAEQALLQAEAAGPAALAAQIRERLALYRAGRPYRE